MRANRLEPTCVAAERRGLYHAQNTRHTTKMAPGRTSHSRPQGNHKVACCRGIAVIYPAAGLPSGAIREPRNCTLEPVYTRTAHDQNEDASLVAGHRVDQLCLHLDPRMGASARAILHAGLAEQAD